MLLQSVWNKMVQLHFPALLKTKEFLNLLTFCAINRRTHEWFSKSLWVGLELKTG